MLPKVQKPLTLTVAIQIERRDWNGYILELNLSYLFQVNLIGIQPCTYLCLEPEYFDVLWYIRIRIQSTIGFIKKLVILQINFIRVARDQLQFKNFALIW